MTEKDDRDDAPKVRNPEHCPICDSWEIEGKSYEPYAGCLTQDVACLQCGAEWQDTYRLCSTSISMGS